MGKSLRVRVDGWLGRRPVRAQGTAPRTNPMSRMASGMRNRNVTRESMLLRVLPRKSVAATVMMMMFIAIFVGD